MKKIGLIGGTSWHSTVEYYRIINQKVNDHFGKNINPPLWIVNLNQHEIHQLQQANRWEAIAEIIFQEALRLESIGVQALALCANTPHKVVDSIQPNLRIPFLPIAHAIGQEINRHHLKKVGLLGTQFTMKEDFIKGKLKERYQVDVIVPDENTQHDIQRLIEEEFSFGVFSQEAKQYFLDVINRMAEEGAKAVILGCTEIPLLLQSVETTLPLIDSMRCHCDMIMEVILS